MLLQVITGTTRQGRFSERVADVGRWAACTSTAGFDVELVDLRDHPLPFFDGETLRHASAAIYTDEEVVRFGATS